MDVSTFAEQLEQAQRGDRASGEQLFAHFERGLLARARQVVQSQLRPKLDAEDLVQDALLLAWHRLTQFAGGTPEELGAWLRRILAAQLSRALRRYCGNRGRDVRRERALVPCGAPSSIQEHEL